MTQIKMDDPPRAIASVFEQLINSRPVQRIVYRFYRWLVGSKWVYPYLVLGTASFFALALWLVAKHKGSIPATGFPHWLYSTALPVLATILGASTMALPLILVAANERLKQSRRDLQLVAGRLSWILSCVAREAMEKGARSWAEIEDACNVILNAVREAPRGSTLQMFSPNAIYLSADWWYPKIKDCLKEELSDKLDVVARHAPSFRQALIDFPGSLVLVLPDTSSRVVLDDLRTRATVLDFRGRGVQFSEGATQVAPEDVLIHINDRIQAWIRNELMIERQGRETRLILSSRAPTHRFLWVPNGELCFFQELPPGEHGLPQQVGCIEKGRLPLAYAAVEACMTTLPEVLG